jgi:hypothetical protein
MFERGRSAKGRKSTINQLEIARVLEDNTGRAVRVVMANGDRAVLTIMRVDGEGCTCKVAGNQDYDPAATYWWSFEEIAEAVATDG